ncbi:MAG: FlgD immunoglobulin-like domain containing protein, partial [Candidatus Cloacimonadales bacterium]
IADAGESNTVLATTNYILDGTGSYDPEGEDITYMWTAPEGIVLSDNASATPHFTAPEVDEATNLTFTLVVNDGQFDSFPSNVTIKVMPILPVINLEFDEETFTFSWNPPGAMEKVFRYDDGIVLNALGAENSTAVLGVTFYEDSIIDKVSWYLTTDAGYHEYVNILITGLNDDGSPDVENILYQEDNVTSDDLIWNHYTLPEPITAPNGFFLGLNYDGFLALAIDDGVDAPYVFQNGTHWAAMNWTNGQWQKLEDMGFRNNFLLRASGLSFGVLDRANQHATRSKIDNDFKLIQIPTAYPIYTAEIERHEHFQNEYNIYIDGELIEASYTDRDYTVSNISNGQHTFAITAVYENYIESDAVLYDFIYSGSDVNDIISLDKPFIKNYPNPFNPSTTISFNLKQDSQVSLIVYNVKGQRVTQLVSQNLKSGIHNFVWDGKTSEGKDSASGIYFYQLQTNYDNRIGKMMLIK